MQGQSVDLHSLSDTTTHTDLDWAVNEQWEDLAEKKKSHKASHSNTAALQKCVCVHVCLKGERERKP